VRTVSKTATVSLHGNHYTVDPALVGYRVELRYDPEDLTRVEVFHDDRPAGQATPEHIGVHVDPKLANQQAPQPGPATGIAYLDAVAADHAAALRGQLSYYQPDLAPRDDDGEHPDEDNPDTPAARR